MNTRVRLGSSFHDAGEVSLSLITGGEAVLDRMTYELPIHNIEKNHEKVQEDLEGTLSGARGQHQLVTWAMLEPNQTQGFERIYNDAKRMNCIYKASFKLRSEHFVPITARIFTPHYIINHIKPTHHTKPMLDFFIDHFSQDVLYENVRPLILMLLYEVFPDPDPLPVFYCNDNSLFFLQEIGLTHYAERMYQLHYTEMNRILYQMGQLERNQMFRLCGFSTRDRAHFVGLCEEYAKQIGRPINVIY